MVHVKEDVIIKRYAAIDIGTNAVRLVIKELRTSVSDSHWYKLCYTRVPIRLGEDVFSNGNVSIEKMNSLALSFRAFKHLMKALNVVDYRACSTSAMREAGNSKEVIHFIREQSDIQIEILSGVAEAQLIMENFKTQNLSLDKFYFYIDVGGGSTEISLIYQNERILSKSFDVGTVRSLSGQDFSDEWESMKKFSLEVKDKYNPIIGVGTGGNINKIFKESGRKSRELLTLEDIIQVKDYLSEFTYEQRINVLKMRPDRADVILLAADIFIFIMSHAGVKEMMVPKIGLSDGIILDLFLKE